MVATALIRDGNWHSTSNSAGNVGRMSTADTVLVIKSSGDASARAELEEAGVGRFACPSVLRGSPIRVVKATEHWVCPHCAHAARAHRGGRRLARHMLSDALVRPVLVEVGHILPEHASQVALAHPLCWPFTPSGFGLARSHLDCHRIEPDGVDG